MQVQLQSVPVHHVALSVLFFIRFCIAAIHDGGQDITSVVTRGPFSSKLADLMFFYTDTEWPTRFADVLAVTYSTRICVNNIRT
ncbi:hypothetical protein KIN20_035745 [Parelaphostrongylus tenuis]|uniref:Secreted protein n=1 Tax=Parelaphostrongylus tenuis TaxID=148309 RepID=A0AAD5RC79_PARTN|nr:hypothetical protein KIN20_035745 [Parelaphostrongylus tenuis]